MKDKKLTSCLTSRYFLTLIFATRKKAGAQTKQE